MENEKKKSNQAWIRLPLAVMQDERITKADAIVLANIIDIIDSKKQAEISVEALMKRTGLSKRAVMYAIKHLKECCYITAQRTGRASIYSLKEEILPPKKRSHTIYHETSDATYNETYNTTAYKRKKEKKQYEFDKKNDEHFEEDYECFINRF